VVKPGVAAAAALIVVAGAVSCSSSSPTTTSAAPSAAPGFSRLSDRAWQAEDLTAAAAAPAAVGGGLAGYVFEAQGTQHVIYLSTPDDHVRELWWDTTGWHTDDLSTAAGAGPAYPGHLVGYVFTAQRSQHVVYIGADRHVHQLWWDGTGRHADDLSALTGAPPASGALAGYAFEADRTQHVLYLSPPEDHVFELWFDNTGWHTQDLTAVTGALAAVSGALVAYVFRQQGTQHVIYAAADRHLHELWWNRKGWHTNDLSAATGAPAAAPDTLAGYVFDGRGTQHVLYVSVANQHIQELWWDRGGWHTNDLAATTGAPAAAPNALSGYAFEAQGTQHVIYRGGDRRLYELWWDGAWHLGDLTSASGAPTAGSDGPVGYAYEAQGTQHVVYIGADDAHVHELWWGPRVGVTPHTK
jgi:hypothetical protein